MSRVAVYRKLPSDGACALVDALKSVGVDAYRARRWPTTEGEVVVCWGTSMAAVTYPGQRVFNGYRVGNKLEELRLLSRGVPGHGLEFCDANRAGPPEEDAWLGRRFYHQSAYDLRETPDGAAEPDFYVRKLNISCEYRVHVFGGKAIRVGKKMPDPDARSRHEWIRSLETGWIINYGKSWREADAARMPELRRVARAAVKAVNYDFAAVDLGVENGTGRIVVFETNQAPALRNFNTALAYAKAIQKEL